MNFGQAHELLHTKDSQGRYFHTIMILIDRIKLDQQLGDTIQDFMHRNGVDNLYRAESIEHLSKAIFLDPQEQTPQKVIVTTTHKLGQLANDQVLLTKLLYQSKNQDGDITAEARQENSIPKKYSRIAFIADEAHRSHNSSTRETLSKVVEVIAKESKGADELTVRPILIYINEVSLHSFRFHFSLVYWFFCYSEYTSATIVWYCSRP